MLAQNLKQIQEGYGWSQAKMAQELGISRTLLSFIYSGKRNPQLKVIKAVLFRFPELKPQIHRLLDQRKSRV